MSIFRSFAVGAAGAVALLGMSLSNAPAYAETVLDPWAAIAPHQSELVQTIDYHRRGVRPRYDDRPRYDRRYHGDRYRSPRGAYRHRYTDGYYYANPWWALGLGFGGAVAPERVRPQRVRPVAPRSASAHVEWCFDRYRSYNARSDTFTGYDGIVRRCRSPYR
jgi:hypothetical protein